MIGQAFLPSLTDDEQRKKRAQETGPVQEAIKILSLSIPRVQGAQGVAPLALMTGGGMPGGGMADPVVEAVLRQFGIGGQGAGGPAPQVTPGIQPNPMPPPPNTPMPKVDFAPQPKPPERPAPRDPFTRPGMPRRF